MEVCFGFFFLLAWAACGYLGYYVAMQKRRDPAEGIILGVVFGPIGAVIVALLPTGDAGPNRPRRAAGSSRPASGASPAPRRHDPLADLGLPPDPPSSRPDPASQGWSIEPAAEDDGPPPDVLKGLRV